MEDQEAPQAASAFEFHGDWREFAPIAFTNLLLSIVTLGIYVFWARARERRYLWSRTRFIDDRLEWAGTGLELFIGYVLAFIFFLVPIGAIQLIAQGLILQGYEAVVLVAFPFIYFLLLYLIGIAIFRGLRYRLSRTHWHGIRGGSNDQGFRFGLSYVWRTIVGAIALGLMVPWALTNLWNRRWRAMSFGPFAFEADADWNRIIGRYLIAYFAPIALIIVFVILIGTGVVAFGMSGAFDPNTDPNGGLLAALVVVGVLFYFLFFVVLGLIALYFYSAYYREAIGALRLGTLGFAFTARTKDWVLLMLGNIGLVIVTLGIGMLFVPYRNWKFFITHIEAYGEIGLDDLTQSTTRAPGQGEGLLDAFDVGAF